MGAVCSGPVGLELTEKERQKCTVLTTTVRPKPKELALLELAKLGIRVHAAEVVVLVRPIAAQFVGDPTELAPDQLKRILRALVLTTGTVQVMARRGFAVQYPNSIYALRQLRLIACDANRDVMILVVEPMELNVPAQIAMYQTPFAARFLCPLAQALADAFVGVPPWAVPVQFKLGSLPVPTSTASSQAQALGKDGGFSSCFAANAVSTIVLQSPKPKPNLPVRKAQNVRQIISKLVSQQQPMDMPWLMGRVVVLDVGKLVDRFLGEVKPTGVSKQVLRDLLVPGVLDCLPFNLEFRTLRMYHMKMDFRMHLARILLYNITLREIDLAGSNLRGMGQHLGQALSMNIQPLVSHLDLSSCRLDDKDWRGLVVGLARLWCGGSTVPQALSVADNKDVKETSWDVFWDLLVEPSTFSSWPTSTPPPPPNLCFLQHLDVSETTASGPSLARLISKLSGLRSLRLGCSSPRMVEEGISVVLQALVTSDAPLETFHGLSLRLTNSETVLADALHSHSSTLKKVVLENFEGNVVRLLCSWPELVPRLSLEFRGDLGKATSTSPPKSTSTDQFSPGSLTLGCPCARRGSLGRRRTLGGKNHRGFVGKVLSALAERATGLTSLYIHDVSYVEIVRAGAETELATCGLKVLHATPPSSGARPPSKSCDWRFRQQFWSTLALSKTLEEIQFPNQLTDCACAKEAHEDEIVMIGKFLKANRSVRRISFDSDALTLDVESVKVLRSAFYGNKKVVAMEYPSKAKANTVRKARETTRNCTRQVANAKASIKRIFKSHYSKYNRNWRDKPNRLKLPYVEKIRTAKRLIGKTNRDVAKIGVLLKQMNDSIQANKMPYNLSVKQKNQSKLARRAPQLTSIAAKRNQVFQKLVTKLHRAKGRGRRKKSSKEQIPRSHYYKNKHMWPGTRFGSAGSSHYRRWNDPYNVRYGYAWLYYDTYHHNEITSSEEGDEPEIVVESEDPTAALPPYVVDVEDVDLACASNLVESPELGLFPDLSSRVDDPWTPMDTMVATEGSSTSMPSRAYLLQLHMEAIELGLDVLVDVLPMLDTFASLNDKVESIAASSGLETFEVSHFVASVPGLAVDVDELVDALPEVDEYAVDEADDAVEMYAGAGPRDLDDGGPCFGGGSMAVEAGARRRARARKNYRVQRRTRLAASQRLQGYRNLSFPSHIFDERMANDSQLPFGPWPDDISDSWKDEVTTSQIEVISQSDLLLVPPEVSIPKQVLEWSKVHGVGYESQSPIDVALVTQCSVDRLDNLREQLAAWKGKASVVVYVKKNELSSGIESNLLQLVEEARLRASETGGDPSKWEVALSIVEANCEDEPYPINYLRNVALLQARSEFVGTGLTLENTAVLLVDVDFRPSWNLYEALHCSAASDEMLFKRRVIVCPAFEDSNSDNLPRSIPELRSDVDNGAASGFHLSHFPPGHSPTDFEAYWSASMKKSSALELWRGLYPVKHHKLFEPYVVLRTLDVPLYDERFQGYGLNKVSHLASIAKQKSGDLFVLPGVFLVAPCHERSQSWADIYGSTSDDTSFSKIYLKGLYHNFSLRLTEGKAPVVSLATEIWQKAALGGGINKSRV